MDEVKVKEETNVIIEPIKVQPVEIKLEKEIEINEETLACTGKVIFIKHEKLVLIEHQIKPTEEKLFQYNLCDKDFSQLQNSHLKTQKSHTGKEPYQCNIAFLWNSHLKTHQRANTGEKPYQCNQCDKAFPHKSYLKTHQRTHTGEKPYKCNQCDKAFSQSNNL
ncbi:unnamed protein product, partial [Meganyctiphanes norvegica]